MALLAFSFSNWQARLITALLYNAMHMATHCCWLSLFPNMGKCTARKMEAEKEQDYTGRVYMSDKSNREKRTRDKDGRN